MSENSGKSRYSPSCHLTAPPAGQHTLGRQSHTAPPSCPTRRNLQGATPGKCVSLKFRCCSISLSPAATSGRHKPLLRTFTGTIQDHLHRQTNQRLINKAICIEELHRTKRVSATSIRKPKLLRIKAKIKSDVCVSYSVFQSSRLN